MPMNLEKCQRIAESVTSNGIYDAEQLLYLNYVQAMLTNIP